MKQVLDEQVRRLPNGAIDVDFYLRRSSRIRSEAAHGLVRRCAAPIARLLRRIA